MPEVATKGAGRAAVKARGPERPHRQSLRFAAKGLWVLSALPRQEHRMAGCIFGSVDRRCQATEQLSTGRGIAWQHGCAGNYRLTVQIKDRH